MTDDELRKLLAEATPGPWDFDCEHDGVWGQNFSVMRKNNLLDDVAELVTTEANARLIAAAPDLAAEVLRLRATLSVITATDCYSREEVTAMARAALDGSK